jgi:hypothetical protein
MRQWIARASGKPQIFPPTQAKDLSRRRQLGLVIQQAVADAVKPWWWHRVDPVSAGGGLSKLLGRSIGAGQRLACRRARTNGSLTRSVGPVRFGRDATPHHALAGTVGT